MTSLGWLDSHAVRPPVPRSAMPLIALAVASYAAGLLVGFAGLVVWTAGGGALVALVALGRGSSRPAALAAIVAAGALLATASDADRARCRSRAAEAHRWTATLGEAAAPGAFVPATIRVDGCTLSASLAVERGRASAGAVATVRGEATLSARGLKVQHAVVFAAGGHARWPALRAAAGARIDSLFGTDAPLVRALLIADTHALDPALRDRFAAAGIVHMLSISGLHVAIIAAAIELVFVGARLPRRPALLAALLVTGGYVALIGAPPPAVRSGVMLAVAALSRLAQRHTSPWAALALGAAAPLVVPRTVLDIGWQLSVAGMASLIASGALARRWIAPRLDGWRASLARSALASVVACTVSAPLVTWTFGRLSLIAPVTNIVATPVVAVLQPTLFLAVCAPWHGAARFVAGAAHPMLLAFDAIASFGARVPYGALSVAPTLVDATLGGVASGALVLACVSPFPARALMTGGSALALALWLPFAPAAPHAAEMELHMIDVGQGDAIAIRTPRGRWVLVDAGRAWRGGDAGRATVIPYLRRRGGAVALFVLTHPHADHAGGASSVLRALHPEAYWDGAYAGTSDPYRESLLAARAAGVGWRRVHPNDSLEVDGVRLEVLAPDSAWLTSLDDPNEGSVIVRAQYGSVRFLLMGDAERGEEAWLLEHEPAFLAADVLKVAHHGSSTSSTTPFLDAVHPRLALVSVGAGNSYGHPSQSVLRSLAAHGAVVLRTDRTGSIIVRTDGRALSVEEEEDTWTLSPARAAPCPVPSCAP